MKSGRADSTAPPAAKARIRTHQGAFDATRAVISRVSDEYGHSADGPRVAADQGSGAHIRVERPKVGDVSGSTRPCFRAGASLERSTGGQRHRF